MSERKTISDSKRAFYQAFPFVIPPIYRGVADELLVELHLLSHQNAFKVDGIFAVGDQWPPRSRAARPQDEERQRRHDLRVLRGHREERASAASLNRLAGGLESEARYRRTELNDETGARRAEERTSTKQRS